MSAPASPAAPPLVGRPLRSPGSPALLEPASPSAPLSGGLRAAVASAPDAAALRAAERQLLSGDFVRVERAFDLAPAARGGARAADPLADLADEQVVLLELAEGGTAVTTAGCLRERGPFWQERRQGARSRGPVPAQLFSRLFRLEFGVDDLLREAAERLVQTGRERLGERALQAGVFGASRLATRLLLQVIEERLPLEPGLYRWNGGEIEASQRVEAQDPRLQRDAGRGLLLFLHGTGSCTRGSFGDLTDADGGVWPLLEGAFGDRIYGFEHRTFSESPIENALALARLLPAGARLHLVSHSRGGLVGDLLCLGALDDALIDAFRYQGPEDGPLRAELEGACDEQRERLRELRALLQRQDLRVERYVRVAAPARGTRLLGESLDAFLSVLLSLVGALPLLAGNPLVAVLKRLVLEIVRQRAHPALVPGIAAMLPDSPFGALLARATPRPGIAMATIAGDSEGAHPLQQLALLFSDTLLFQRCPNDLVVDTDAMTAGIAAAAGARLLAERGPGVSHFHYFSRPSSRAALGRWLTSAETASLPEFLPLGRAPAERERSSTQISDQGDDSRAQRSAGVRAAAALPVVVVLPGTMGSHLWVRPRSDRIWFDPADLAFGAFERLRDIHDVSIEAEKLFDLAYGDLCRHLLATHRVVRFPYDWRQPLDGTAERLAATLRPLLADAEATHVPVRLLAHSMGGLVVRALIAREPELWQRLIGREGARLVMLGTPNQGSHQMVETLLGKSGVIRNLARVDLTRNLQGWLDIVAGFPGALQLLPQPGFQDVGGEPGPEVAPDRQRFSAQGWFDPDLWQRLRRANRDRWFGDGLGALPLADALERGRWFWDQQRGASPAIPGPHPERVIYVYGQAPNTPCGLVLREGRPLLLGTPEGDGSVTWRSGHIGGIGSFYRAGADHGGLVANRSHFDALAQLLEEGATRRLEKVGALPALRAAPPPPVAYECGPAGWPSEEELLLALVGGRLQPRSEAPPAQTLRVSCHAMDLRYVTQPVMVGHYANDPIAAAEALIDREIVAGELSSRRRLGLYAGPPGTATVVLMNPSEAELHRGCRRGAVVIGLGSLGDLTTAALTEAVRVGVLRYLLQIVDRHGGEPLAPVEVGLASLLLGQNSTTAIDIADSVAALVRGVMAANAQFTRGFPRLSVRVARLQIVEVYLDTAITATRALGRLAERINTRGESQEGDGAAPRPLEVEAELQLGKGWRHRLDAAQGAGYWPRLVITEVLREAPLQAVPAAPPLAPADPSALAVPAALHPAGTLSYAFLGERARAELLHHQRQPGLVEALVEASIRQPTASEDLCRTLFQLLVPPDFKELARRMEQLVLVLDDTTANLPWELLQSDHKPLALAFPLVRQLQSPRYRIRVRQTTERTACVIGNPATAGFFRVFTGQGPEGATGLTSLEGAASEARVVARVLAQHGYAIEEAIETECGVDVINRLYRHPYRVLHIAGHGVFEHPTVLGDVRSGVVLSDGMLITAAEIEAMEVVPDLVFLNCCHLGTIDRGPIAFHRLAASVARQLIEMGVRAVVACGWAVDDQAAVVFAETFYAQMLADVPFGQAVFQARLETQRQLPQRNTWGAYQAYGDPSFVLEPPRDRSAAAFAAAPVASSRWRPVTPHELIDRLAQLEVRVAHTTRAPGPGRQALAAELQALLAMALPAWAQCPELAVAAADAFASFGGDHAEEACRLYREAIRHHRPGDGLPIQAIEQLANLDARRGEASDDEHRIESALRRLEALITLAAADAADPDPATAAAALPTEWAALLGSTHKRLAALRARRLTASRRPGKAAFTALRASIEAAIAAYGRGGGDPYLLLNRLLLEAVRDLAEPPDPAAVRQAGALWAAAHAEFRSAPDFWNAVTAADARLLGGLLDRSLADPGPAADRCAQLVLEGYREVFSHVQGTYGERTSVLEQLALLRDLVVARGRGRADACPAAVPLARRLSWLLEALRQLEGEGTDSPAAGPAEADVAMGDRMEPEDGSVPLEAAAADGEGVILLD